MKRMVSVLFIISVLFFLSCTEGVDSGVVQDDIAYTIEDLLIDTALKDGGSDDISGVELVIDTFIPDVSLDDTREADGGYDIDSGEYDEDIMAGDEVSIDVADVYLDSIHDTYEDSQYEDDEISSGIYISSGDPYSKGGLAVKKVSIVKGTNGATVDSSIYIPQGYNEFATVIFQHGFLLDNNYYSDLLEHIASHGFVVVAPQMYKADGIPIGKPKTTEEADTAIMFYNWLKSNLNSIIGVNARMDILGLAGHSRGGKVIWTLMLKDPSWTKAMAGVDPVDGTGGPLGGESRIADKPFSLNVTSLIIGTGLGPESQGLNPACAPEGDNHVQFYNASQPPAYHSVAVEYGHLDMLNDSTPNCGMVCTSCKAGPDRKNMRIYTAGQLTAFFRYTLQGDSTMLTILTDPSKANIKVRMENK